MTNYDPRRSRENFTNYLWLIFAVQGANYLWEVPASALAPATVIMVLLTVLAYLIEPAWYWYTDSSDR